VTTGSAPIGSVPGPASRDTVAAVVTDAETHTVSSIQSLFRAFGSGVLEPETGILCHNGGSAFSLDPASPKLVVPGKRPAHTLMPVLVRHPDGTVAALDGTAQPQVIAK
jgi:gamma-glutamyltranspeptidase